MMLEKGIATVTVGFPATVLAGGRVRFCISAAHTREMLDKVCLFLHTFTPRKSTVLIPFKVFSRIYHI